MTLDTDVGSIENIEKALCPVCQNNNNCDVCNIIGFCVELRNPYTQLNKILRIDSLPNNKSCNKIKPKINNLFISNTKNMFSNQWICVINVFST